ncbi:MAG TPA: pantoate--beta-alanine ligase, partial [Longimicrobiales bacterium]|nr:pantoate--beta-alanine ligase [Longimicrobiales bacterium]
VVREDDGLAMSSRNVRLSPDERSQAVGLHAGLRAAREAFRAGERDPGALLGALREEVEARPLLSLQYAEIVDPGSLDAVDPVRSGSVAAVAAHCGDVRLIDNAVLE